MTTKELINQYVTAHADNRWMDASELEALLTEFAEELKEPASEELEQEIDDYTNSNFSECYDGVLISDAYSTELTLLDVASMARYFAQWQKKQIMKDAIDAEVYGANLILQDGMPKGLSDNDKVKVIIIKE